VRKVDIQRVLAMCMGNRLQAAQVLGIGRTSLYRYLERDQLEHSLQVKLRGAAAVGSVRT
jgi:transcriptional regulator of acetoin/glycerol metabolism